MAAGVQSAAFLSRIAIMLIASCGLNTVGEPPSAPPEAARPYVVFVMPDDHAFQAADACGHPISKLAPSPNVRTSLGFI